MVWVTYGNEWVDGGCWGTSASTTTTTSTPTTTSAGTNIYFTDQTSTTSSAIMPIWTTADTTSAYSAQRQYMNQMMYAQAQANQAAWQQQSASGLAGLNCANSRCAVDEDHRLWLEQQQREQQRELARHAAVAKERAQELLLSHLTPEQKETFDKNGWFVVEGGKSKTKYRIRIQHAAANIDVLDANGNKTHRLCAHCRTSEVPLGDHLLTQKFMLECDEDAFLKIANRHAA